LAKEFGIAKICNSLQEICSLPDLQAIDVVTPEGLHAESVLRAFASDKHVFVEKPLALDLKQCKQMIDAAEAANRVLMVGHLLRFETKYAIVKDEIAAGRLGKVVSLYARRNRPKSLLPRYGRTHPALENCIHDIDLMLWYTQSRAIRVRGFGRSATGGHNHDTFWGVIEFESGAIGVVETIWLIPPSAGIMLDDALEVIGDQGVANIRLIPGSLEFWHESGRNTPDIGYDPRVGGVATGALREELANFCEGVANGRPSDALKPADAMAAAQIALALVESAHSGRDVEITVI
jgi:UDP-N-acetylglucosamine 3-dehydrogenase